MVEDGDNQLTFRIIKGIIHSYFVVFFYLLCIYIFVYTFVKTCKYGLYNISEMDINSFFHSFIYSFIHLFNFSFIH